MWIQSLDLTYSVRNVRRDFANGFLIAEVFSRYYPKHVQLHSFSNGVALHARQDNFEQLSKIFIKVGFECERGMLRDIMRSDPDAAADFLEDAYAYLTSKKALKRAPREDEPSVPAFARETASNMIKKHAKRPDMVEIDDRKERERRIRSALQEHNEKIKKGRTSLQMVLAEKRKKETGYGDASSDTRIVVGKMRQVSPANGGKASPIITKSIEVKQMVNFGEINRAGKRNSFRSTSRPTPEVPDLTLMSVINSAIDESLGSSLIHAGNVEDTPPLALVRLEETLHVSSLPLKRVEAAFERILDILRSPDGEFLATESLSQRRDAWVILTTFASLMECLEIGSRAYDLVCDCFVQMGKGYAAREADASIAIFLEMGFPRILPLLRHNPTKRHDFLGVLYAFAPPGAARTQRS